MPRGGGAPDGHSICARAEALSDAVSARLVVGAPCMRKVLRHGCWMELLEFHGGALGRAHVLSGDRSALLAIARDEYANAKAALPLVDADSRLGFECSMEYCGGREQIGWKLARMKTLYGGDVR